MNKDNSEKKLILDGGIYVIADPCYLIGKESHKEWLDVARQILKREEDCVDCDIMKYKSRKLFWSRTEMGDGYYDDQYDNRYAVDTGSIPCVFFRFVNRVTNTSLSQTEMAMDFGI